MAPSKLHSTPGRHIIRYMVELMFLVVIGPCHGSVRAAEYVRAVLGLSFS